MLATLLGLALLSGGDPLQIALAHVEHPEVVNVMTCESGLEQWNEHGQLIRGAQGEVGIAQFLPGTWDMMNKMRGTDLDIENPIAQVNMIDWAFGQGLQNHWTCYRKIYGT